MKIEVIEIAGLNATVSTSARLSHKSESDDFGPRDISLMKALVAAGDEHAKALRGAMVWVRIQAPRYFWHEFVTYRIGCEQLGSESTMHDQPKLTGEALLQYKASLPEGTLQTRIFMISYQTLRRMYQQRRHHRLPEWQAFCDWIENLPYAGQFLIQTPKSLQQEQLKRTYEDISVVLHLLDLHAMVSDEVTPPPAYVEDARAILRAILEDAS